jgi:Glycosyl hydrolase family 3 C-terminal domain
VRRSPRMWRRKAWCCSRTTGSYFRCRRPHESPSLVTAVAAANPQTIVVTLGPAPVIMPWLEDVPAVIHAWFPGEQFAAALADVLTGRAEPGGRLPVTFPADESATPIQDREQYPGVGGVATYSEEDERSRIAGRADRTVRDSAWGLVGGAAGKSRTPARVGAVTAG